MSICSACGEDCMDDEVCYLNRIEKLKEELKTKELQVDEFRKLYAAEKAERHKTIDKLAQSDRLNGELRTVFDAAEALIETEEKRGEFAFQVDCLLDDLRKAVHGVTLPKCDSCEFPRGHDCLHCNCPKCCEKGKTEKR